MAPARRTAQMNSSSNRRRRVERRSVVQRVYSPGEHYGFANMTFSQYQTETKLERAHEQKMGKQANVSSAIMAGGQLVGDLTAMTGQLIGMNIQGKQNAKLANIQGRWGVKVTGAQAKLAGAQAGLTSAQASLAAAMRPTPWALIIGVTGAVGIGLAFVLTRDN